MKKVGSHARRAYLRALYLTAYNLVMPYVNPVNIHADTRG
jgi:hypothetical protein